MLHEEARRGYQIPKVGVIGSWELDLGPLALNCWTSSLATLFQATESAIEE